MKTSGSTRNISLHALGYRFISGSLALAMILNKAMACYIAGSILTAPFASETRLDAMGASTEGFLAVLISSTLIGALAVYFVIAVYNFFNFKEDIPKVDLCDFAWSKPVSTVLNQLGTNVSTGITSAEASHRLDTYGNNEIVRAPPPSVAEIVREQFSEFINFTLFLMAVACTVLTIATTSWVDLSFVTFIEPIALLAVLVVNLTFASSAMSFISRVATSLNHEEADTYTVRRDGALVSGISGKLIAIGDIVTVRPQQLFPADGRVICETGSTVDQSKLTGESRGVRKTIDPVAPSALLAKRSSVFFGGSRNVGDTVQYVVTAVGMDTAVGMIAKASDDADKIRSPIMEQSEEALAVALKVFALVAVLSVFLNFPSYTYRDHCPYAIPDVELDGLARTASRYGIPSAGIMHVEAALKLSIEPFRQFVQAMDRHLVSRNFDTFIKINVRELLLVSTEAVAFFVAGMPETLGTAIQVIMAVSALLLQRYGLLVKNFGVFGNEPADGMFLWDKTGTLTTNLCTFAKALCVSDGAVRDTLSAEDAVLPLLEACVLVPETEGEPNNTAVGLGRAAAEISKVAGVDPAELAREYTVLARVPFSSVTKFSAVLVAKKGSHAATFIIVGAEKVVLPLCSVASDGAPLTASSRDALRAQMNSDGILRWLVCARMTDVEVTGDPEKVAKECCSLAKCALVSAIALENPVRVGAVDTIAHLRERGTRSCIITGDDMRTAVAVALATGIVDDKDVEKRKQYDLDPLPGDSLATLPIITDAEYNSLPEVARAISKQNIKVVSGCQYSTKRELAMGNCMGGDGVNDTAALAVASVGFGIGGVDAKKEATVEILGESLHPVMTYNTVSDIARQVAKLSFAFGMSSNIPEILIILLLSFAAPSLFGLTAVWQLILNLTTDGLQPVFAALMVVAAFKNDVNMGSEKTVWSWRADTLRLAPAIAYMTVAPIVIFVAYWIAPDVFSPLGSLAEPGRRSLSFREFYHSYEDPDADFFKDFAPMANCLLLTELILCEMFYCFSFVHFSRPAFHVPFAVHVPFIAANALALGIYLFLMYNPAVSATVGLQALTAQQWWILVVTAAPSFFIAEASKILSGRITVGNAHVSAIGGFAAGCAATWAAMRAASPAECTWKMCLGVE